MRQCKMEENKKRCPCTYEPCEKKGICCDCLKYHWQRGELPGCLFPSDIEATYDRSIEKFIRTYQERGRWW